MLHQTFENLVKETSTLSPIVEGILLVWATDVRRLCFVGKRELLLVFSLALNTTHEVSYAGRFHLLY